MITRVNPTVIKCGHKLHQDKHPNNNCVPCWEAYFHTQANLEQLVADLRVAGSKGFIAKHGVKLFKNFRGFIAQQLMAKKGAAPEPTALSIDSERVEIQGSTITTEEIDAVSKVGEEGTTQEG